MARKKKNGSKSDISKALPAEEVPLATPGEGSDIDLAGLSDSTIPMAEMESESGVAFDLRDAAGDSAERTLGVSLDQFPDLAKQLGGKLAPDTDALEMDVPMASEASASSSSLFGTVPPKRDLATTSSSNVFGSEPPKAGSSASASDFFDAQTPGAAPASSNSSLFDARVPSAAPASSASSFFDSKLPSGLDAASASSLFDAEAPSAFAAGSSANFFGKVPNAVPVEDSATNLDAAVPAAPASGWLDSNADEPIPVVSTDAIEANLAPGNAAAASSSNLFGTATTPSATPAGDSAPNLEPLTPVEPAAGWFETHADEPMPSAAVTTDPIEANLSQPESGVVDGSDIFAGPVPAALPKSDVSDVIAATAYSPARPVGDEKKKASSRASDVALNFDRPPGGSTIESASAAGDLPVAEEALDSLFDEPIEPNQLVKTEPLHGDDADLGAMPVGSIDASSILADLSEPGSAPGDSSAIRLEEPGVDATLRSELEPEPPKFTRDSTELDMELPDAGADDALDWHSQSSGSDLFADRTQAEFELLPDVGMVDPFADELTSDQPSLSTAPSSIFSSGKMPAGSGSASNDESVPVGNYDSGDSVEFSDHPDPGAADSGSFHVLPAGSVDFDLPAEALHPERSMGDAVPEAEDDWVAAQTGPGASGILARKKHDPTDEMAPVPATPVHGKPDRKPEPAKVIGWTDDAVEPAPAKPKRTRSAEPEPVSRRGIAGLALGLLLGVGASAGVYFSGILPNKEGTTPNGASTQVVAELQNKNSLLSADLTAVKEKVVQAEKLATAEKSRASQLDNDLRAEKDRSLIAEKDLTSKLDAQVKLTADQAKLAADLKKVATEQTKLAVDLKAMTDTLAADLKTAKEKSIAAEKEAIAEKAKVAKLEKDVKVEKDTAMKIEKDLKAMLDKVSADAKKDIDTAKADLTKANDALASEKTEKIKLADAVKARQATMDAIAKDLQAAKLLAAKYDDAAVIAAARSATSRATGPDLNRLIPSELSSIAGTGLTTGHILDLAARTNKFDSAAKTAAAEIEKLKADQVADAKKMMAEITKLKSDQVAETKKLAAEITKLKTDQVAEAKKMADLLKKSVTDLNDAHAIELKKASDAYTTAMEKLKADQTVEAKAMAALLKKSVTELKDAHAVELKKLSDSGAVAMDKLKAEQAAKLKEATDQFKVDAKKIAEAYTDRVKSLEAAVALERSKAADAERRFKTLGGAATLAAQELDRLTALSAARSLNAGISAYKAGRYADAELALDDAAKHDPNDALAWYFLGATRWAQGKVDAAKAAYRNGAEREGLRLVPARQIDDAIGAIQGPARDALGAVRP